MALLFEAKACNRCGGSGRFGPMQVQGGVCFGCGGAGQVLTKRGSAAQDFYRTLTSKDISELQVGDVVQYEGITGGGELYTQWRTISEIGPVTSLGEVTSSVDGVVTKSIAWHHSFTNPKGVEFQIPHWKPVRVRPPLAERQAFIDEALAYQETLTQAGTVRRGKVRA